MLASLNMLDFALVLIFTDNIITVMDRRKSIDQAFSFLKTGEIESAYDILELLDAKYPNDSEVLHGLGLYWTLFDPKYIKTAAELLKKAWNLDKSSLKLLSNLIVTLIDAEMVEEAEFYLLELEERDNSNPFTAVLLFDIYAKREDLKYLRYVEIVLMSDNVPVQGVINVAKNLAQLRQFRLAEDVYLKALSMGSTLAIFNDYVEFLLSLRRYAKAKEYCMIISDKFPDDKKVHSIFYKIYIGLKEYDTAEKLCLTMVAEGEDKIEWKTRLANTALQRDDLDSAVKIYSELLALSPDDLSLWNNLGFAYNVKKDFENGIKAYHHVLQVDKLNEKALNGYGYASGQLGLLEEAQSSILKAIELYPEEKAGYMLYADLLCAQGKYRAALTIYQKALIANPQMSGISRELEEVALKLGETEIALASNLQRLRIEPDQEKSYSDAAAQLINYNTDIKQALAIVESGIEILPESYLLHCTLGKVHEIDGNIFMAEKYYKIATQIDINRGEAYTHLGVLYSKTDHSLALYYLQEAFARNEKDDATNALMSLVYHNAGNLIYAKKHLKYALQCSRLDPKNYVILYDIGRETNPDRETHFHRFMQFTELYKDNQAIRRQLQGAIEFNLTMLIERITLNHPQIVLSSIFALEHPVILAKEKNRFFKQLICIWRAERKNPGQAIINEAVINYELGDIVNANKLLALEVDRAFLKTSMIGLYYYIKSIVVLEFDPAEKVSVLMEAVKIMLLNANPEEQYYAALIYEQVSDYRTTVKILKQLSDYHRPSQYKLALVAKSLIASNRELTNEGDLMLINQQEVSELYSKIIGELLMLEKAEPFYSKGIDVIKPSWEENQFIEDIIPVLQYIEIQELLGQLFIKPFEITDPFCNLISIIDQDDKKKVETQRDQLPFYWKRIIAADLSPELVQQVIRIIKVCIGREEFEIADRIMKDAMFEYSTKANKTSRIIEFDIRLYTHVICSLYQEKILTFQQAINLINYSQYCLVQIPEFKSKELMQFFTDTVAELLIDAANLPMMYWLQKIIKLNDLIKEQNKTKYNVIVYYDEFVQMMSVNEA